MGGAEIFQCDVILYEEQYFNMYMYSDDSGLNCDALNVS